MIRPKADRLFDRFRRTGDPQFLARVFDRTAPELGRVASYLCRNRADAEDAVQTTFLAAFEHRQEWDGGRPLLPWLLGLLAHRVQQQRRGMQRRPDPARLPERAPEASPPAVAAEREFAAEFERALARVPEPFAAVLRHHLVDGEAPFEIAARLGLPAATVRTRLHRGLEQLRRRLPAGAGALLAVPLLLPAEALAAVRLRVLAEVPGGAAVSATSASTTGLLAIAGAAVLMTVGIAFWWHTAQSDASLLGAAELAGGARAVLAANEAMPTVGFAGAASPGLERVPAPAGSGDRGTVRLLVRTAGTLAPLVDVPVQVVANDAAPSTEPASAAAAGPGPSATTVDGPPRVAQMYTDAAGRGAVVLQAGPAEIVVLGHAAERSYVVVPADGAIDCTIDVTVSFTADVKVVDGGGQPVADARILAERNGVFAAEWSAPVELGRTGADGHWRSARTERLFAVWAAADDRADSALVWLRDGREVELRLGGASVPLVGRVVDADGAPLAGALIACVPDGHPVLQEPWLARTAPDGSFELRGRSGGRHHLMVQPAGAGRRPALAMTVDLPAAGDREWTIRLPRPAQLQVVVRRGGGEPFANTSVLLQLDATEPFPLRRWLARGATTDGNGEVLCADLVPGRWQVELFGGLGQQVVRTIDFAAGAREQLTHTFDALTELVVEIVDAAGAPVAGLQVLLGHEAESRRTDAQGRVRFHSVGPGAHAVTVTPATNALPIVQQQVATGAVARIVVPTQPAAGQVRGRLRAGAGIALSSLLPMLQPARFDPGAQQRSASVVLDEATGAFTVDAVPAGSYVLTVVDGMTLAAVRGPIEIAAAADSAGQGSVPIDLGDIEVGRGVLRVLAEGPAADQLQLAVGLVGIDVFAPKTVDAAAPSLAMEVPVGRWRALVWGPSTQPVITELEVRIGAVAEARMSLARGVPTTLRMPAGFGLLTWTMPDGRVLRLMVVGSREFVRGAPAGHHRVELVLQSSQVFAAEFDVGETPLPPVELIATAPR
ncbi:MAG: sigma-70 family RNA polymerase sigma factor [Planctomycetes bacterium]|nr:sigma-70 family RNA polymerase sigma factor [Planctomycetota bacterium]